MRACWRCSRSYENSNRAFNHHLPWSLLLSVIFFFLFFYGVHFLQLICIQIHFVYSLSRHRLYQKQFNFAFQRFTLFRLSFYTSSARHRSERSNPKSTYGFVLTSKYATVMRRCLPKNRSCSAAAQGLLINRLERQANSLTDRVIPPSPDEQNVYMCKCKGDDGVDHVAIGDKPSLVPFKWLSFEKICFRRGFALQGKGKRLNARILDVRTSSGHSHLHESVDPKNV